MNVPKILFLCGGWEGHRPREMVARLAGALHERDYIIRVRDGSHPVTQGLPAEFGYRSEQYYMTVDPAVHVLADTRYRFDGRDIVMPVAWVKPWGRGRVFYHSLGPETEEFERFPEAMQLTMQGIAWALRDRSR